MSDNYTGAGAITRTDEPERKPAQDRDEPYAGVWPDRTARKTKPVPSADRGPAGTTRELPKEVLQRGPHE